MSDFTSQTLLGIFQSLDSKDLVKNSRVNQRWRDIIINNKPLWQFVYLPQKFFGWDSQILDLFDRRSGSCLKEVFIHSILLDSTEKSPIQPMIKTLQRSSHSLKVFYISFDCLWDPQDSSLLSDLVWTLPNLIDFRVCHTRSLPRVSLDKSILPVTGGDVEIQDSTYLNVLWMMNWERAFELANWERRFEARLPLLKSISSLSISNELFPEEWRKILEPCSKNLKHLNMTVWDEGKKDTPVELSKLEVLEINVYKSFPMWLICPQNCTLVLKRKSQNSRSSIPGELPSFSRVWLETFAGWENLTARCPELEELRIDLDYLGVNAANDLVAILNERKHSVEAEIKVDGVKMVPLKRLIIPFQCHTNAVLPELRVLVEEVINEVNTPKLLKVKV